MYSLTEAIRRAHLLACLANECDCITIKEHESNVKKAKELENKK